MHGCAAPFACLLGLVTHDVLVLRKRIPHHRPLVFRQANTFGQVVIDMDPLTLFQPLRPTHETNSSSLKDRFNYASFSCAALILSTSKGFQHASALLNDGKDQYMLTLCEAAAPQDPSLLSLPPLLSSSASSKYVNIELCADIKIDTLVVANYEFFSSTFRHFSLWISDRYPPRESLHSNVTWINGRWQGLDQIACDAKTRACSLYKKGWRLIGSFEAENARGPQVRHH